MSVSRTSETMEQAEIDRLLSGVGGSATMSRSSAVDLQVYDFRRPHRVSKERLRTLEVMYERLVKSLRSLDRTAATRVDRGNYVQELHGVESGRIIRTPESLDI